MVHSMTGFGRSVFDLQPVQLSIEVKSLNSKQLDLNCKLPFDFRNKELEIRNLVGSKLIRGKIDVSFMLEQGDVSVTADINENLLKIYYNKLKNICDDLEIEKSDRLMLSALKMPDVITSTRLEINEPIWNGVKAKLAEAVELCIQFRIQEGKVMEGDLKERIHSILKLLKEIAKYEPGRIESIRQRIKENMNEHLDNKSVDENRFEQEMLYYIEKIDVSEEKIRLENHCNYFLETLNDDDQTGKKLNFISQEIGREINTLGSKANNFEIQRIVVQMKDDLEKIKEQVLNVL